MIAAAVGILCVQVIYPTERTAIWLPFLFVIAAVILYRIEIKQYSWGNLLRLSFWEAVFFALTQGMVAQAAGIVLLQFGAGIEPPALPFQPNFGVIVSAVVFSAILEEMVYRKAIFGLFRQRFSFWPAAVISSLLFASAHADYSAALGYFLLGLVWCRAYQKSGTIAVPIAAHMIFNLIAMFVMQAR